MRKTVAKVIRKYSFFKHGDKANKYRELKKNWNLIAHNNRHKILNEMKEYIENAIKV